MEDREMKKFNILFFVPLVVLSLASCHKDLNVTQNDQMSASNMWKTSAHVEGSTVNIYATMRENFVQQDIVHAIVANL